MLLLFVCSCMYVDGLVCWKVWSSLATESCSSEGVTGLTLEGTGTDAGGHGSADTSQQEDGIQRIILDDSTLESRPVDSEAVDDMPRLYIRWLFLSHVYFIFIYLFVCV